MHPALEVVLAELRLSMEQRASLLEALRLSEEDAARRLPEALARREALLRFVDPGALGDFRWLAFGRGVPNQMPRFSQEPDSPTSR